MSESADGGPNETLRRQEAPMNPDRLVKEFNQRINAPDMRSLSTQERVLGKAVGIAVTAGTMDYPLAIKGFATAGELITDEMLDSHRLDRSVRGEMYGREPSPWGAFASMNMCRNDIPVSSTKETLERDYRAVTFQSAIAVNSIPQDNEVLRQGIFNAYGENDMAMMWWSQKDEKVVRTNAGGITSLDQIQIVDIDDVDIYEAPSDTKITIIRYRENDHQSDSARKRYEIREKLLYTHNMVMERNDEDNRVTTYHAHEHGDAAHAQRALGLLTDVYLGGERDLSDQELTEMLQINDMDYTGGQFADGGVKSMVVSGELYEQYMRLYNAYKNRLPHDLHGKFSLEKFSSLFMATMVGKEKKPSALNFRRSLEEELDSDSIPGDLHDLREAVIDSKSDNKNVARAGRLRCADLIDVFNKDRNSLNIVKRSLEALNTIRDPGERDEYTRRVLAVTGKLGIAAGISGLVVTSASSEGFVVKMPDGAEDSYSYYEHGELKERRAVHRGYVTSAHAPFQEADIAIRHEQSKNRLVLRFKADWITDAPK